MEDTVESVSKLFEQRLHFFSRALEEARNELSSKDEEIQQLQAKVEAAEQQKAQAQKENKILTTEIGKTTICEELIVLNRDQKFEDNAG